MAVGVLKKKWAMNPNLDRLRASIQDGKWFSRLGGFSSRDRFVAISNHEAWAGFTRMCVATEFGIPVPDVPERDQMDFLQGMDWMPTSQGDDDPFHGSDLINRIKAEGKSDLLKAWRLDLCKIALAGFRSVGPSPWLKVGPTDYSDAAKQGLLFAIRMALAEIVAERPGIWCSCCDLYVAGHWPMGRLPSGEIVVL